MPDVPASDLHTARSRGHDWFAVGSSERHIHDGGVQRVDLATQRHYDSARVGRSTPGRRPALTGCLALGAKLFVQRDKQRVTFRSERFDATDMGAALEATT